MLGDHSEKIVYVSEMYVCNVWKSLLTEQYDNDYFHISDIPWDAQIIIKSEKLHDINKDFNVVYLKKSDSGNVACIVNNKKA